MQSDDPGGGRHETDLERADRNLMELLAELRVLTTGVQILFAFLLTVPFSTRFIQAVREVTTMVSISACSGHPAA